MAEKLTAAAFGEVLWDILPEKKCLGGAPLNCAGHLNRLGIEASIVSALGKDELGTEALSRIEAEQISTGYLQILDGVETGFTHVALQDGIPSYEFNDPCAWDKITLSPSDADRFSAQHWNIFVFGSLAQRSETSRKTLYDLLSRIHADTVFFDVNIRKSFYSESIIRESLKYTDILKMNDEEVPVLAKLFNRTDTDDGFISWLIAECNLKGIIVTRGKTGPAAYFDGCKYEQAPSDVPVVDTVGAGDSFSAGFLASLIKGKSVKESLAAGTALADFVVAHDGALPAYDEKIKQVLL